MHTRTLLLAATLIALPALAADTDVDASTIASPQALKGDEIKAMVSGKTYHDETKNSVRRINLQADGTLNGVSDVMSGTKGFGKMGQGSGSWKVEGNKLCMEITWKTSEEKWCRVVVKSGNQHYILHGAKDAQKARPFKSE